LSNDKMVEVTAGLQEDDEVVLNPRLLLSEKDKAAAGNYGRQGADGHGGDISKESWSGGGEGKKGPPAGGEGKKGFPGGEGKGGWKKGGPPTE
jgi:hypothetical protein